MELNISSLSVDSVQLLFDKIKHIQNPLNIDITLEGKTVNFTFSFKFNEYTVYGGPYLSSCPKEEWFCNIVTKDYPTIRKYNSISDMIGEIFTIMYMITNPELI